MACVGPHISRHSKEEPGPQKNVSGLLVICDRIQEEMCTTHTPNFAHLDIHKTTGNGIQT